jgi:hypothetical protein
MMMQHLFFTALAFLVSSLRLFFTPVLRFFHACF